MGIIINEKKHYLTRFPLWLLVIIFLSFSPFIIGEIGGYFFELIYDKPCHEDNCIWGALGWLGIFCTLPGGALALLVYFIVIIIDSIRLYKSNQ